MSKYRFKTEEEFKRDGLWIEKCPKFWVTVMNKYLGKDIPDSYNTTCDKQDQLHYETWSFNPKDYVLKEAQPEYTVGKWYGCKNWSSPVDFIKLERVYDGQAYFTECLNAGNYQKEGQNWWSFTTADPLFEADMSIVSPLLPDGHLYEDGKWAELVSLPETTKEMFYEGDYIVTLDVEDGYNCARKNYCFKQRITNRGIYPTVDLKGSTGNGHGVMSFGKKEYLKDWRYATPEEAAEYERIGKPYDVTTLQTIPEYIECTSSKDSEPYFIKGNVYKVVKASPISSAELKCNILKDYEEHNILYTRLVDTDGTKLFKPSTKEAYEAQNASVKTEYIPQVGDYVVMERAGGWGYHPENNGCIAIVEKVSTRNVGYSSSSVTVSSIGGQVINAKRLGDVTFTNVPIVSHEKQLVFRKALPHEIPNGLPKKTVVTEWLPDPIVEQRISTPSINKETFIDNVQSVDVILRTKRKSIKF